MSSQSISTKTANKSSTAQSGQRETSKWFGIPKWSIGAAALVLGGFLIARAVWFGGETSAAPPPIFIHVSRGDGNAVKADLTADASSIHYRDPDGNTPLHIAASNGSVAIVRTLLDRGADPNTINGLGLTPLALAVNAAHNRQATVQSLISSGATPAAKLPDGRNILLYALSFPDVDPQIVWLLSRDHSAVEARDAQGNNAVAVANLHGLRAIADVIGK